MNFYHQALFQPTKYVNSHINISSHGTFKNHISAGVFALYRPYEKHDYFEARVENRLFVQPATHYLEAWISTDFRKKLALEVSVGGNPTNDYGTKSFEFTVEPRYRPNDRLLIVLRTRFIDNKNNIGFVEYTENEDTVFFGKRNILELENRVETRYIFNEKASLSFDLRHYWSTVEYNNFYILRNDGGLNNDDSYTENPNINFNYFTVDLAYRWIFAPGSELSVVWKNSIFTDSEMIEKDYFNNLSDTFKAEQTNSFSVRLLYYLDYLYLKRNNK